MASMMFNRTSRLAVRTDDNARDNGARDSGGDNFSNALHPTATHAAAVEMVQEWIKALVTTEHKAFGIWSFLKGPAKLKSNVEVQGILPIPGNFQEIHAAEPMGCRRLPGDLGWILTRADEDDGPKAVI
ncbi:protein of unknown function (plasmid) [Cupriavidus neocaledonicus]|uniref:Uncharacterized protein n=1 Tax=Cupriavidus neocaledonicus TaxID=1040979 RepID=A0A375HWD7_9BURK|nr:protein of unknown function [Cupriavidus neocaledonicus]